VALASGLAVPHGVEAVVGAAVGVLPAGPFAVAAGVFYAGEGGELSFFDWSGGGGGGGGGDCW